MMFDMSDEGSDGATSRIPTVVVTEAVADGKCLKPSSVGDLRDFLEVLIIRVHYQAKVDY